MGGVEEIGEEEADKLKGHGYHGVPNKAKDRPHGESFDVYLVTKGSGGENGGLPIWGCRIRSGLFVGL
jgi:hypothetical protein